MRLIIPFLILIGSTVFVAGGAQTQQEKAKDPCDEPRFHAVFSDAPSVNATDIRNLPQCLDGKFVRMTAIYRTAYENSHLYDPITGGGGAWVTFKPFYAAVKRCSPPGILDSLQPPNGGTYGFVALGVFYGPKRPTEVDPKLPENIREALKNSPLGYGHMNAWPNEFQVICIEKLVYFSDGNILQAQKPEDRQRIIDWYTKETTR